MRGSRGAGELGRRFDDFFPNLKISSLNAQQLTCNYSYALLSNCRQDFRFIQQALIIHREIATDKQSLVFNVLLVKHDPHLIIFWNQRMGGGSSHLLQLTK